MRSQVRRSFNEMTGPRGGVWHSYPERDGQPMQGFARHVPSNTPLARAVFRFAEQVRPAWVDRGVEIEMLRATPSHRLSRPRHHANAEKLRAALTRHFA